MKDKDINKKVHFLEEFVSKHTVSFVVLFIILDQFLLYIRVWGVERLNSTEDILQSFKIGTVFYFVFGLIFILISYLLGDIKKIGLFHKRGFLQGLLLGLPMLFLIFYYLLGYYNAWDYRIPSFKVSGIFIVVLYVLSISFFEEIEFRAVLYLGLLKHEGKKKGSVVTAAIISSILFGVGHISNGFENRIQAILFVINAVILGLFWSSIFIKVKNIWSVILLHALADLVVYLPCVIFSSSYAGYMAQGAIISINELLGTSLNSIDGITQYIVLNVFCIPIFVASIIYMKLIKKNEDF